MSEVRYQLVDTVDQLIPHLQIATRDLEEKQRNFYEGTNNPIAYTVWHFTRNIDQAILSGVAGMPSVWEAAGYREKLGFPSDQRIALLTHDQVLNVKVEPWGVFLQYVDQVFSQLQEYLMNASEAELLTVVEDGRIDSEHPRGPYSKARIIRGRLTHASMHSGEIFAIRGALGLKGSPV